MRLRLFSNSASVASLEISVLGVAETIIATTISLWLAWHYSTILHIAIGMGLAPLLLMRTSSSTSAAHKIWLKIHLDTLSNLQQLPPFFRDFATIYSFSASHFKSGRENPPIRLLASILVIINLFFLSFFTKLVVFLASIFYEPKNAFKAIPRNWFRYCFCISTSNPPELFPEYEIYYKNTSSGEERSVIGRQLFGPGIKKAYKLWRIGNKKTKKIMLVDDPSGFSIRSPVIARQIVDIFNAIFGSVYWILIAFFLVVIYGPSVIYRFSIKSTSLFWLPVLFVRARPRSC